MHRIRSNRTRPDRTLLIQIVRMSPWTLHGYRRRAANTGPRLSNGSQTGLLPGSQVGSRVGSQVSLISNPTSTRSQQAMAARPTASFICRDQIERNNYEGGGAAASYYIPQGLHSSSEARAHVVEQLLTGRGDIPRWESRLRQAFAAGVADYCQTVVIPRMQVHFRNENMNSPSADTVQGWQAAVDGIHQALRQPPSSPPRRRRREWFMGAFSSSSSQR